MVLEYITLRLVFTFALASASLQFEQESLHPELNFTLWSLSLIEATLPGVREGAAYTYRYI